ncbi:DUF4296 domain-containing protein [Aureivirga sp. CE67]|uniref:DUF4296 domain-containing protein n=1 Tax=Aureivirga sp. CE67 TaxID=1788983 RepID=UPI0018CB70CB|nr:DUF4296 domain-containing protein [Aureivirga sp. CE67]
MKKFIYILLAVFVFSSCKESNTIFKEPENLIPKEKLIDLMVDMQIAQGAYSVKNKNQQKKIDYMPFVYEKYKIDSAQFSESIKYYITTVDEYSEIMYTAQKRLEDMREKVDKERLFQLKSKESKNLIQKKDSISDSKK